MNAILYDVALTFYIVATVVSFAYLVGRREGLWRLGTLMTQAGWVCHTAALVARGVELERIPLVTLPEVVSVVIWVVVLLELWAERQYGIKVLGAFVLPVVLIAVLPVGTFHVVPVQLGVNWREARLSKRLASDSPWCTSSMPYQ